MRPGSIPWWVLDFCNVIPGTCISLASCGTKTLVIYSWFVGLPVKDVSFSFQSIASLMMLVFLGFDMI